MNKILGKDLAVVQAIKSLMGLCKNYYSLKPVLIDLMRSNKQKVFTMIPSISLWRPAIQASVLISSDKKVDFKKRTELSNHKNKDR